MPEQNEPPRPHGDPLEEERLNTGKAAGQEADSEKRDRAGLEPRHLDKPSAPELVTKID